MLHMYLINIVIHGSPLRFLAWMFHRDRVPAVLPSAGHRAFCYSRKVPSTPPRGRWPTPVDALAQAWSSSFSHFETALYWRSLMWWVGGRWCWCQRKQTGPISRYCWLSGDDVGVSSCTSTIGSWRLSWVWKRNRDWCQLPSWIWKRKEWKAESRVLSSNFTTMQLFENNFYFEIFIAQGDKSVNIVVNCPAWLLYCPSNCPVLLLYCLCCQFHGTWFVGI